MLAGAQVAVISLREATSLAPCQQAAQGLKGEGSWGCPGGWVGGVAQGATAPHVEYSTGQEAELCRQD